MEVMDNEDECSVLIPVVEAEIENEVIFLSGLSSRRNEGD